MISSKRILTLAFNFVLIMNEVKYFAYGSNLRLDQMRDRGVNVKKSQRAELPEWKITFPIYSEGWGGGVADIVPDSKERVEGVVYTIEEESLRNLDHYEGRELKDGREFGMYRRQYIPVSIEGKWKTVLTYVVNLAVEEKKERYLSPSKKYLETIIIGAREHGLDSDYIERLKKIPCDE